MHFVGVEHYEKNVANQLLDFCQIYTSQITREALSNRAYRDRSQSSNAADAHLRNGSEFNAAQAPANNASSRITVADVKLAMKFNELNRYQRISSKQISNEAKEKNHKPLAAMVMPTMPKFERDLKTKSDSYYRMD